MAKFMNNMLREDLWMIDAILDHERRAREEQANARAQEERPQEHLEPMRFLEVEFKEEKRYGEELQERKDNGIFTKPSTSDFMKALKPEIDSEVSEGQREVEAQLARSNYARPFTIKVSLVEKQLEPEPRVKLEVPKPEPCEDPQQVEPDYDCALDKLSKLDKTYKGKNFGFYGKPFRSTHATLLNFFKHRKTNPVGHPNARFNIDEDSFMEAYCELFFEKPTMEEVYYMKPITYGCEDHRLKTMNNEAQDKRSFEASEGC